ncbi:MAG: hypothetical protein IT359_15250 [Gemmatimonadaceae bacterium]|nr:hypothetical protein [Gemmatimonadaceae bacterium]
MSQEGGAPITPARLLRIRELFDAALELATEERAPYLARACAGDDTLQGEVASLLAALDRGGATWERSLGASLADVAAQHDEDAAIEEGGDVLVIEVGEDLAFVAEAADGEVALEAAAEELEGDAFLELVVGADALVDGPHPAVANQARQLVSPDPAPHGARIVLRVHCRGECIAGGTLPGSPAALQRGQQALHLEAQREVVATGTREVVRTRLGRHLERRVEQLPDARQARGGESGFRPHGSPQVSHARATSWRLRRAPAFPSAPPAAPPRAW